MVDALLSPTTKPTAKLTALDRLDALRADPEIKPLDLALPYKSRKGKSAAASIETEEKNLLHLLDALMMEDEPKVKPPKAASTKVKPLRAVPLKVELPKELPKDLPKAELPKVEPPRAASPKVEPPRAASPKVEPPRAVSPKVEPPKAEAAKASKAESLSVDTSAESTPELETLLSGDELN